MKDNSNTSRNWAVVQINSGPEVEPNLEKMEEYIKMAARAGNSLVAFPELALVRGNKQTLQDNIFTLEAQPLEVLREAARTNSINLLAGTIPLTGPGERFYNTALFIDASGEIVESYRKIHLFDIDLEKEFSIKESAYMEPGKSVKQFTFDGLSCGVGICYDLRFPELFRQLAEKGARIIFIPANFTYETGQAHWEPLLRARAIENQCYVIAPAQCGKNRETEVTSYGNSMVIDPWGKTLARAGEQEELLEVEIDLEHLESIRRQLPALQHRELK